ncbi:putative transcription factor MYB family [Arabidopsis thaliana]|uniref:FIP2 n=2 Tax=Arabidopsis TaxID=3701 RepID=A0A178UUN7_ARATH|nr:Myb-like domain [Arabidopsis thaliana x Arabidopsis arenosa]OAO97333.1 FIP2 [Arabidopsis thaliana]
MTIPDDGSPVAMAIDSSTAVTVATTTTRRVPPPCWTDEETAALVNAYKDKWFALRRGNLRAADWDDVAAAVSSSSTVGGPPKSAIQCRHKIEKLRKRYRGEKQRALNRPGKFSSSWDLFPILDAMGFAPVTPAAVETYDPDVDHDDESNGLDGFRVRSKRSGKFSGGYSDSPREVGDGYGVRSRARNNMKMYGGFKSEFDSDHDSGSGFGLKRKYNGNPKVSADFDADSDDEIVLVPKATRLRTHGKPSSGDFSHGSGGGFPLKSFGDRNFASHGFKPKNFSKPEPNFAQDLDYDDEFDDDRAEREGFNPRIQSSRSSSRVNGYSRKEGSYPRNTGASNGYGSSSRFKHEQMNAAAEVESDPIDEVVSSVKMLTEMFVRVENSKMEMMREMEKSRMEMELKHCQMMLESQQQIIGAFAEALSEKKSTNARRPVS